MGEPLPVYRFEGVLAGELGGGPLLLAMFTGVNALGYQRAGFIPQCAGLK